jgi:hypothetical protein
VIKGRKRKLIIEIVIVSDGRNYGNIVPFGDKQCYLRNKKVVRKTEKHTFGRKLIQPRKKFFAAPILPFPNKLSEQVYKRVFPTSETIHFCNAVAHLKRTVVPFIREIAIVKHNACFRFSVEAPFEHSLVRNLKKGAAVPLDGGFCVGKDLREIFLFPKTKI